jgi:hypothetical protein
VPCQLLLLLCAGCDGTEQTRMQDQGIWSNTCPLPMASGTTRMHPCCAHQLRGVIPVLCCAATSQAVLCCVAAELLTPFCVFLLLPFCVFLLLPLPPLALLPLQEVSWERP